MTKQVTLIIVLSIAGVLMLGPIDTALNSLLTLFNWIENSLTAVFSGSSIGHLLQMSIALLLLPICVGAVAGTGYYAVKRSRMPNLMFIIWGTWLLMLAVIAMRGA